MDTIAFPLGTLIWTQDAPRPIETLQAGDTVIGFNPDTFSRVPVTIQRVQIQERIPGRQLQVGGRIVTVAGNQSCSLFDLNGDWYNRPAVDIHEGDFLPVDRQIPVPAAPIALPHLDDDLTARLDEDPLALSDALYNSTAYFREMDKRALRLMLYELCGYLCGAATMVGKTLQITLADPILQQHYAESFHAIFGATPEQDNSLAQWLRHWLGDGLANPLYRMLPVWIWTLPTPACSAFLRGFFDTTSRVSEAEISVEHSSLPLISGIQTLLGRLHIEATLEIKESTYQLTIRNVRRFAEWVNSHLPEHAGILKSVYTREPRYPSESTAHLPLNVIRPALERIRNRHAFPTRTADTVDEREATHLETLRLLATAFHDVELRDVVNQQLYLEPVMANITAHLDTLFILSVTSPATVIANGVVIGGKEIRVKRKE